MSGKGITVFTAGEVERWLPVGDCIPAMAEAFRAMAESRAVMPLRQVTHVPGGAGALYSMPGLLQRPEGGTLAVKLITVFPENPAAGLESHQGVIVVFDARNGEPRALIEAGSVTAIRTAAVSALATQHLAVPDASLLAILGSGVQARTHLEAMLAVRPITAVRVWSRNPAHARSFVAWARARYGLSIEAKETAETAVRGADVICTVTAAREPLLHSEWVAAGAHINAVGASVPTAREIDSETVARAAVIVDSREAALAEAGDLLIPMTEGIIGREHIRAELAEIVTGRVTGRRSGREITLFKSLGLAIEDAAAAQVLLERAAGQAVTTIHVTGPGD